ncbi:nucleotide sugar dehydrogenase [Rhodoplanes roseus]|uniref:UDP-glucose/GDP-mannose dehydrogenase C-terminal domain-containing protein n=1 Tax=Rhodoplanes roseus TaxID=29409 RepID=A0A327KXT4_9BRAD|nr:nucleotide sugar dehydrogenase [Rhodoplanes roseus]RAI43081.1 hypothetical protein CH341_16135 [Rhodoplanes roseus]
MQVVAVVGAGHVGLPLGILFARGGYRVILVDTDQRRVSLLRSGKVPQLELSLANDYAAFLKRGIISISDILVSANVYVIAVPTPVERREPMLRLLFAAIVEVSGILKCGDGIILVSTCPVGTTAAIARYLKRQRCDLVSPLATDRHPDYYLAISPERAMPQQVSVEVGCILRCVGGVSSCSTRWAVDVLNRGVGAKCMEMTDKEAEYVKLAENTFRDVNIALANELDLIARHHELDPGVLLEMANTHPRVAIHLPGVGVGGHCIPVDPWLLAHGIPNLTLIPVARFVNDSRPKLVASCLIDHFVAENVCNPLLLGVTYKENSADFRNSPSLAIICELQKVYGENIRVVDPLLELSSDLGINLVCVDNHIFDEVDAFAVLVKHRGWECLWEQALISGLIKESNVFGVDVLTR